MLNLTSLKTHLLVICSIFLSNTLKADDTSVYAESIYGNYTPASLISRQEALNILVSHEALNTHTDITPQSPLVSLFQLNELNNGEYSPNWLYKVNFEIQGHPSKSLHAHIDALTGKILKIWNETMSNPIKMSGFGGNTTSGLITFGEDLDPLYLDRKNNGNCYFETTHLKTIDLANSMDKNINATFNFPCDSNSSFINNKQKNGSYSPLNEAHFYGVKTVEMFTTWFNEVPHKDKIELKVHYSNDYENAMWNSKNGAIFFGDGRNRFHALTDINLVAHEIAHGFTEQQSNLAYKGMAGAINESFSDITGEALEYFIHGNVDWTVAADIAKKSEGIRFFDRPEKDGYSISHMDSYDASKNIHQANGIFNHAFYLIATSVGWNVKSAYAVFYYANKYHWKPTATFDEAACGVYSAARDLALPLEDIVIAFDTVGVNTCSAVHVVAENAPVKIATKKNQTNQILFEVDEYAEKVILSIENSHHASSLMVAKSAWPTTKNVDCVGEFDQEKIVCELINQGAGRFNALLTTDEDLTSVTIRLNVLRPDITPITIDKNIIIEKIANSHQYFAIKQSKHIDDNLRLSFNQKDENSEIFISWESLPSENHYHCKISYSKQQTCLIDREKISDTLILVINHGSENTSDLLIRAEKNSVEEVVDKYKLTAVETTPLPSGAGMNSIVYILVLFIYWNYHHFLNKRQHVA